MPSPKPIKCLVSEVFMLWKSSSPGRTSCHLLRSYIACGLIQDRHTERIKREGERGRERERIKRERDREREREERHISMHCWNFERHEHKDTSTKTQAQHTHKYTPARRKLPLARCSERWLSKCLTYFNIPAGESCTSKDIKLHSEAGLQQDTSTRTQAQRHKHKHTYTHIYIPLHSWKVFMRFKKRPAWPQQPNLYLEPKWLRCWWCPSDAPSHTFPLHTYTCSRTRTDRHR